MKELSLRIFILLTFLSFHLTIQCQPCQNGFAGLYPCSFVDQLSFVDLSVFESMESNDVWGWYNSETGREYALLGLMNGTAFVDITSPYYPIYLGKLPTATEVSIWRDIKVIDHFAFIGSEAPGHGLQIFDLKKLEMLSAVEIPKAFSADAHYVNFGNSHNIVANPDRPYIYAVGTSTLSGGPHVVNVSDPLNPIFAGSNDFAGYTHDAQVVTYNGPDPDYIGKEICVGFNQDKIVVYDVSDLTDIEVVSQTTYDNVGYTHQGWFTEDMRYLLSNDETDELTFDFNTRTIIWDMLDLDSPQVLAYTDYGNTSIDHNLYIRDHFVYESNYTSGLRIFDLLSISEGNLFPFGYFDVSPEDDDPTFSGSWSNYPFFDSGVIPTSGMETGLHILKPRFFELDSDVIKICDENTGMLTIKGNRRIQESIDVSVSMPDVPGLNPVLTTATFASAPFQTTLWWEDLSPLAPGYYSGEVIVGYGSSQEVLPFVLIKALENSSIAPPVIESPTDIIIGSQQVTFTFTDDQPGFVELQVALDETFGQIIYQEVFYSSELSHTAYLPFKSTEYFWRLVKPGACGEDLISNIGNFTIDAINSANNDGNISYFEMYPNPVSSELSIKFADTSAKQVVIYDLSGRVLYESAVISEKSVIDVSSFASGIYVIKERGGSLAKKFIKL